MRRVRLIYYTRKVINPFVIESFGLIILGSATAKFVSFSNVITNSPSFGDFSATSRFWSNAWQTTEIPTQGLSVAIIFLTGMLCVQATKLIRSSRQNRALVSKISPLLVQKEAQV
jgi:hypothetical protein